MRAVMVAAATVWLLVATVFLAATALTVAPARAQDDTCGLSRPVTFAGLDYDSAAFHTALAQRIIAQGFGCKVDRVPGQTIPLLNGLARGDLDVVMEIWTANPAKPWVDALAEGKVVSLGVTATDATEGWFVPRYLVEGPAAKAAGLKAVADLPAHKGLFADPEDPAKGRFYNCVPGWQCELVNTKKLKAYGLDAHYTNFTAGSGEALAAAVESAVKRERPVLFYHWGPTWLLGKYDFVKVEEPPFDRAVWEAMLAAEAPKAATAYPVSKVVIGANAAFAEKAPALADFLRKYEMTSAMVSRVLAHMRDTGASAEKAAEHYLATDATWTRWVPAEVAARVKASL